MHTFQKLFVLFLLMSFVGCGASRKTLNANKQASANINSSSVIIEKSDSLNDRYQNTQEQQTLGYTTSGVHYIDQSLWAEEVTRRIETILDSLGRPTSIVETETERRSGVNDIQLMVKQTQLLLQHRLDSISRELEELKNEMAMYRDWELRDTVNISIVADEIKGEAAMTSNQLFWKNIAKYIGGLILIFGLAWRLTYSHT